MDGAQVGVLEQTPLGRPPLLLGDTSIAADWNRRSVLKSWAISLTSLWKGSLRMRSAVLLLEVTKCHATAAVPAQYLCGLTCLPFNPRLVHLFQLSLGPGQCSL